MAIQFNLYAADYTHAELYASQKSGDVFTRIGVINFPNPLGTIAYPDSYLIWQNAPYGIMFYGFRIFRNNGTSYYSTIQKVDHQRDMGIVQTSLNVQDFQANDMNIYDAYPYAGYVKFTPRQVLLGQKDNSEGLMFGGSYGSSPYYRQKFYVGEDEVDATAEDGYDSYSSAYEGGYGFSREGRSSDLVGQYYEYRDMDVYKRHVQRLEMMIKGTGEQVTLYQRKWTGPRCPGRDPNREQQHHRCYTCLTPGTKILMGNYSIKNIEDVKVNDVIISHTGKRRKVTKLFERSIGEEIYSILMPYQRTLRVTGEHPVLTIPYKAIKCRYGGESKCVPGRRQTCYSKNCNKNPFNETGFRLIKNLRVGDCILTPVMQEKCDNVYSKEMMRILGYYTAEGNFAHKEILKKNNVKVARAISYGFSIDEKETYGEELKELYEKEFGITGYTEMVKDNSYSIRFFGTEMCKKVKKLAGEYSKKKMLDSSIIDQPKENLLEFLGAYINGDGYQSKRGAIVVSTVSQVLAYQLELMFAKCNIITNVTKQKNFSPCDNDYSLEIYTLIVAERDVNKIASYCKAGTLGKRQYMSSCCLLSNYIVYPIRDIVRLYYNGPVYNLEVEKDNSYIANRLAVHNCFGTGIIGGYDLYVNPDIPSGKIWMRPSPVTEDLSLRDSGLRQEEELTIWVLPVPAIRERDLIIRYDTLNRETWRYEVLNVTRNKVFFEDYGAQQLVIKRFEKTDPIYKLGESVSGYGYGYDGGTYG
jgi:intein/homing endonuclease